MYSLTAGGGLRAWEAGMHLEPDYKGHARPDVDAWRCRHSQRSSQKMRVSPRSTPGDADTVSVKQEK